MAKFKIEAKVGELGSLLDLAYLMKVQDKIGKVWCNGEEITDDVIIREADRKVEISEQVVKYATAGTVGDFLLISAITEHEGKLKVYEFETETDTDAVLLKFAFLEQIG